MLSKSKSERQLSSKTSTSEKGVAYWVTPSAFVSASPAYPAHQQEPKAGEEPESYFKRCLAQEKPVQPVVASQSEAKQKNKCVELIFLRGKSLGDYGSTEAVHFYERGFAFLVNDLTEAADDRERLRRLLLQPQVEFPIMWGGDSMVLPLLEGIVLRYYSYAWKILPQIPDNYETFRRKFAAGERLKAVYNSRILPSIEPTMATSALEFYEQAFQFHQAPVPDPPGHQKPPHILNAILSENTRSLGIGYAVFPGEAKLRPLRILATTDLEEAILVLRHMEAARLVSSSERESREKLFATEAAKLRIKELSEWFSRAEQSSNFQEMVDLRLNLAIAYRDLGDESTAERFLAEACQELRSLGEFPDWVARTLDLISYKISNEQWTTALELIQQVKDIAGEMVLLSDLQKALEYQELVHEKLGLPKVDYNVLLRFADRAKGLPDTEEPNRTKRIQSYRQYLARSDAPPYLKLQVGMQLANSLYEVRELGSAEQLLIGLRRDMRKWKGIPGELDLLDQLLIIESSRGNFGLFYSTLRDYEADSQLLRGQDWLGLSGRRLARIFFQLQDYHKAQTLLTQHMEGDYIDALKSPLNRYDIKGRDPVHDEDRLLAARIKLELGEQSEAAAEIASMSDAQIVNKDVFFELAQLDEAVGREAEALAKVTHLLAALDPKEELDLWTKAMIEEGRIRLFLHQPATDIVVRFEEMAPQLSNYPELNAVNAVDMDLFLGDYYREQKSLTQSEERFRRGLAQAEKLGAVDQKIILNRKLGELAAESTDLGRAVTFYRQSIDLLGSVSHGIPSDLGKVGYRAERNKAIPLLASALYALYQQSGNASLLEQFFDVIEEGKSKALAEMLLPADSGPSHKSDLKSVRSALPADAALLEYYIPEGAADRVFRVLVDRRSISVEVLATTPEGLAARVRALLDRVTRPESFNEATFKTEAAALARFLLPDSWYANKSTAVRRLFIVPSGILYLFPFSLLVDEGGHYLEEGERIEIAYLPNAAALRQPAPRFADASRSAGFVNPALDEEHHEMLSGNADLRASLMQAFQQWSGGQVQWEEPLTAEAFLRRAANIDNIFLYSHGRFIAQDPMGSYVRFVEEKGRVPYVSGADLVGTKVGRGLWVLAACSTGLGKVRSGDEVLGLPRALLEAGASMVVISLWDIDSKSSLELVTRFYEELAQGVPVASALSQASSSLRRAGKPPYDWAPFILIGHHGFQQ